MFSSIYSGYKYQSSHENIIVTIGKGSLSFSILFCPEKFINILCANFTYTTGAGNAEICNPVQYVERGNRGTIYCSFGEDSHNIFWYDTLDVSKNPIFYLEDNVKSGEGFTSGEFDIHANGSLIINNVSLGHEHNFTVLQLQRADSYPIVLNIQVVVTGMNTQSFYI